MTQITTGVHDGGSRRGFTTGVHDGGSRRGFTRGFTARVQVYNRRQRGSMGIARLVSGQAESVATGGHNRLGCLGGRSPVCRSPSGSSAGENLDACGGGRQGNVRVRREDAHVLPAHPGQRQGEGARSTHRASARIRTERKDADRSVGVAGEERRASSSSRRTPSHPRRGGFRRMGLTSSTTSWSCCRPSTRRSIAAAYISSGTPPAPFTA